RSRLSLIYHWLLWGFFTLLIFGQALGIVWPRVTNNLHLLFGQDPSLGLYQVLGTNDAPFTDRAFICVLRGRVYKPMQLQEALDSSAAAIIDSSGTAVNGYRMIKRTGLSTSDVAMTSYANTCELIASTMEAVLDRCEELGYNVTRDSLRIVEDSASKIMKHIPDALPVVVIPFSDSTFYSRYAIPGWDGNACLFRLNGAYETEGYPDMTFRGVNRTVREQKTVEMLGKAGGVWRNGWYEDLEGDRWYSEFFSTDSTPLGIATREFDMLHNTERDCSASTLACGRMIRRSWWGTRLVTVDDTLPYTTVTILNASHYGYFLFEAIDKRSIESVYDLDVILANLSLGALLIRWLITKIAMLSSYRSGEVELQSVGIGVLSCARGFQWLPLFLLPRLKTNLAVFASVGGTYEGAQAALAEAWFIMYPGIAELLLFSYSLLNLVAKLLNRRMSDVLFGPTLIFFCAMHFIRTDLAQSGWFEYDGRIVTILSSKQFDQLSILDCFRDSTLLKLNGNVESLFFIKVGVLSLNLLPLLFSKSTAPTENPEQPPTTTEVNLALRLVASGGLGPAISRNLSDSKSLKGQGDLERVPIISSFELLRLGYLIVGGKWLVSIYDWYLLVILVPVVRLGSVSMRVMVFAVKPHETQGCYFLDKKPVLCRIDDPRISKCSPWQISTRPFR
ncbi:hypothetical protein Gpo141_00013287, partial [Globisporangium polare]